MNANQLQGSSVLAPEGEANFDALSASTHTPGGEVNFDALSASPTEGEVNFDALSATRAVDGSIVISGHIDADGGAFPTPVVALDDDGARWLITTLTALLDRRGHLQVVA
jgi:hypothetical protein